MARKVFEAPKRTAPRGIWGGFGGLRVESWLLGDGWSKSCMGQSARQASDEDRSALMDERRMKGKGW